MFCYCRSGTEKEEDGVFIPCFTQTFSKKLLDIGFSYKHGLEDIFNDTFKYAEDHGLLKIFRYKHNICIFGKYNFDYLFKIIFKYFIKSMCFSVMIFIGFSKKN